ncbi:MAG: VIT1/CCC1 transporter family protein [Planctomycetes bacterium]|nr:VIT1/CCC1 transporter family protein [Planctomycetota bacterium]
MILQEHEPRSAQAADVLRHYLGDLVFGANDGLVTTFTVVSGVAGARLTPGVLLIIGFVNLIADGFSMGASNFLAIRASASVENSDRGYAEPLWHALATFSAFVLIGSLPLVAYLVPSMKAYPFAASCFLTGAALFGVGSMRSLLARKTWILGGIEMLLIGAMAAGVAYGVGATAAVWIQTE